MRKGAVMTSAEGAAKAWLRNAKSSNGKVQRSNAQRRQSKEMQGDAAKAQLYTGPHGKGMAKICVVLQRRSIATNGKGMEVRRVETAKQRGARQWRGLVSMGAGGKAMAR